MCRIDDTKMLNKRGWPERICLQMASPLLQDIYHAVGSGRHQYKERKARLLFGHAESLIPILCQLGLFGSPVQDGPTFGKRGLPSTNVVLSTGDREGAFASAMHPTSDHLPKLVLPPKPPSKRTWWGATIAPYAGNVLFVVYEPDGGDTGSECEHMVQVVVNEQIVRWDGIMAASDSNGLLPLEEFQQYLETRIDDFAGVCETAVDDSALSSLSLSSCSDKTGLA
jgi:hypothetical protein